MEFFHSTGAFKYNSVWNVTSSGSFHAKTGWHYLTYIIYGAGAVQSLYCDGILANETFSNRPINYLDYGTMTRIGTFGGPDALSNRYDYDFYGRIDEVRVCRWGRSADWIKLCYMNQRADDKLIIFQLIHREPLFLNSLLLKLADKYIFTMKGRGL